MAAVPESRAESGSALWRLARDVLPVVVIALVVMQLLRRHVAERYVVPTGSMQPTLFGDPIRGDVVLVDKLAGAGSIRLHDLVVLDNPDAPGNHLVKRIAAVGDDPQACCIDLRDGDLWLGSDRQQVRRDVKDPLASASMRLPWFRWPGREPWGLQLQLDGEAIATGVPAALRIACRHATVDGLAAALAGVRNGRPRGMEDNSFPPGCLASVRPVDASYLALDGSRGREGSGIVVNDFGCELAIAPGRAVRELVFGLEQRDGIRMFRWELATGLVELRQGTTVLQSRQVAARMPGTPVRVAFGHLDGRDWFAVDGTAWCIEHDPLLAVPDEGPRPRPALRSRWFVAPLGLVADGSGAVDPLRAVDCVQLEVFRDIHHFRERVPGMPGSDSGWPLLVPPGQLFLLGDNSFDSRDSRVHGPYPRSAFVGRPRAVIGPVERMRWL